MNLFPLSVKLYHNIGATLVGVGSGGINTNVEKWEYRSTKQLVSLLPSSSLESNQQRQCFIDCDHCGRRVTLNLTEKTYALISHSILTDPEKGPFVRRFIVRRARSNFFIGILVLVFAVNTIGLGLECLLSMILGLNLSDRRVGLIVKFQIPLTLMLGVAIGKVMQSKHLRTHFVFMELREKPTDRETEISRLKGVALYRLVTGVEIGQETDGSDHALSLGSEKMIFTYKTSLKTDPMVNSEISKELEKFVLACEPIDARGASSGTVFY